MFGVKKTVICSGNGNTFLYLPMSHTLCAENEIIDQDELDNDDELVVKLSQDIYTAIAIIYSRGYFQRFVKFI